MRKDVKIKKVIDAVGGVMALVGWGGIGGAIEGHGSPIVAITVFSIGLAMVIWGYQR